MPISQQILDIARQMELFEATASVANTGTGSRREGAGFERLTGEFWEALRAHAVEKGAGCTYVAGSSNRRWAKLVSGDRSLYLPNNPKSPLSDPAAQPSRWLEVDFAVSELVAAFPGETEAVRRYAPGHGPFGGDRYPGMYVGKTTRFDDTIVMEQAGILKEKILVEYKTAKSSRNTSIDGNAHERLSFQIMQYLEIATRYTKCSLVVLANGAFIQYKNKYHVNFHVQADRLANFAWFSMDHACTADAYVKFASDLLEWLWGDRESR